MAALSAAGVTQQGIRQCLYRISDGGELLRTEISRVTIDELSNSHFVGLQKLPPPLSGKVRGWWFCFVLFFVFCVLCFLSPSPSYGPLGWGGKCFMAAVASEEL